MIPWTTRGTVRLFCTLAYGISFLGMSVVASRVAQADDKNPAYMGTGSCSSSNCHGSVSPRNSTNVLQTEYVTWDKHDAHSKAWVNLSNADSIRIAKNLGIPSAEKEPQCLACHAVTTSDATRTSANFTVQDGVSCELCHGAAENYLGPHTANDATHENNLKLGMVNIVAPGKRAELCLSCHVGNEEKVVDHRLIGAGHPRLTFELDTFSQIEPKHWKVDEDYKKRKGDYSAVRAWLVGQTVRGQSMFDQLISEKRSKSGIFPELTNFNCYACHHSLTEEQWKTHEYNGSPGELSLNVSSAVIIREAFSVINPKISTGLSERLSAMHKNYKNGDNKDVIAARKLLVEALKVAESIEIDEATTNKLLKKMVKYGAETPYLQYEVAEQVAMGISSIITEKSPDGSLYKSEVDAMYEALKDPKAFVADDFTTALKNFSSKVKA